MADFLLPGPHCLCYCVSFRGAVVWDHLSECDGCSEHAARPFSHRLPQQPQLALQIECVHPDAQCKQALLLFLNFWCCAKALKYCEVDHTGVNEKRSLEKSSSAPVVWEFTKY